jgi:hypothetical protein
MTRLKLSGLAFCLAAATALVGTWRTASADQESTCVPEGCILSGGTSICCLLGTGSMTCSPCGSTKPVGGGGGDEEAQ